MHSRHFTRERTPTPNWDDSFGTASDSLTQWQTLNSLIWVTPATHVNGMMRAIMLYSRVRRTVAQKEAKEGCFFLEFGTECLVTICCRCNGQEIEPLAWHLAKSVTKTIWISYRDALPLSHIPIAHWNLTHRISQGWDELFSSTFSSSDLLPDSQDARNRHKQTSWCFSHVTSVPQI